MQIVTKAQQLNLISLIRLLPQQQNGSVCKFFIPTRAPSRILTEKNDYYYFLAGFSRSQMNRTKEECF